MDSRKIARCHFKSHTEPIYCVALKVTGRYFPAAKISLNNHQAPHFNTFLHVFERLGAHLELKHDFICQCSAPSLRKPPEEQRKLSLAFTNINKSNPL